MSNEIQSGVDLLIDDGSHFLKDQLLVVDLYLKKLSGNGFLVIEDIQRGYRDACKILRAINPNEYCLSVHDNRFKKYVYDDFVISITAGKTSTLTRVYFKIRSYTFIFEHLLLKILKIFKKY